MTPKSIFGPRAEHIKQSGECWIWTAAVSREGSPLMTSFEDGKKKLRAAAWVVEKLTGVYLRDYATTCLEPRCIHPEHVVGDQTEPGRMVFIRNNVQVQGDCQLWGGWVSGDPGSPYMQLGDTLITVRKFQYCVEYLPYGTEWPEGEYRASCGNSLCVTPRHVVPPGESGSATNRSEWMPELRMHGDNVYAKNARWF